MKNGERKRRSTLLLSSFTLAVVHEGPRLEAAVFLWSPNCVRTVELFINFPTAFDIFRVKHAYILESNY